MREIKQCSTGVSVRVCAAVSINNIKPFSKDINISVEVETVQIFLSKGGY